MKLSNDINEKVMAEHAILNLYDEDLDFRCSYRYYTSCAKNTCKNEGAQANK